MTPSNERMLFAIFESADRERRDLRRDFSITFIISLIFLFVLFLPFAAMNHQGLQLTQLHGSATEQKTRLTHARESLQDVIGGLGSARSLLSSYLIDAHRFSHGDIDNSSMINLTNNVASQIDSIVSNTEVLSQSIEQLLWEDLDNLDGIEEVWEEVLQNLQTAFPAIRTGLGTVDNSLASLQIIIDRIHNNEPISDIIIQLSGKEQQLNELIYSISEKQSAHIAIEQSLNDIMDNLHSHIQQIEARALSLNEYFQRADVFQGLFAIETHNAIIFMPILFSLIIAYLSRKTQTLAQWHEHLTVFCANSSVTTAIQYFIRDHLPRSQVFSAPNTTISNFFRYSSVSFIVLYYVLIIFLVFWGRYTRSIQVDHTLYFSNDITLHDDIILWTGIIINIAYFLLTFFIWIPRMWSSLREFMTPDGFMVAQWRRA